MQPINETFWGIRAMKWYHIVFICISICIIAIIFLLLVPIVNALACVLSKNIIFSNNNIAVWIAFFGNIISVILSGIITIIVFFSTMRHNRKIEEKKRIESMMPFLTMDRFVDRHPDSNEKIAENVYLTIKNIGLNSAIEITSNLGLSVWDQKNENNQYEIPPLAVNTEHKYPGEYILSRISDKEYLEFHYLFKDILGNKYRQSIKINKYGFVVNNTPPQRI